MPYHCTTKSPVIYLTRIWLNAKWNDRIVQISTSEYFSCRLQPIFIWRRRYCKISLHVCAGLSCSAISAYLSTVCQKDPIRCNLNNWNMFLIASHLKSASETLIEIFITTIKNIINEPCSVERKFNTFATSIGPCQPAQSDMGRNFSRSLNFLHSKDYSTP